MSDCRNCKVLNYDQNADWPSKEGLLKHIIITEKEKNQHIEADLQIAVGALDHYASENNWKTSSSDERGLYADEYMLYRHGYLKAREALGKIRANND